MASLEVDQPKSKGMILDMLASTLAEMIKEFDIKINGSRPGKSVLKKNLKPKDLKLKINIKISKWKNQKNKDQN